MTSKNERALLRLLCAGRFDEFDAQLQQLLGAVDTQDEAEVRKFAGFLESALLEAKNRRSHYARDFEELQVSRKFFNVGPTGPTVDLLA